MGDRANIILKQYNEDTPLFLYTHWCGHELPRTLQEALARRQRWDDPTYLARIIFDTMIGNDQGGETGFGISTSLGDNEYNFLYVNVPEQTVSLIGTGGTREKHMLDGAVIDTWSFADYVDLDLSKATWDVLDGSSG